MKALQLLKTLKDDYIHGELTSDINEAIKEIEDLTDENKTLANILIKVYEEMIKLREENQELKNATNTKILNK